MKSKMGKRICKSKTLIFIAFIFFVNFLMAGLVDFYKKGTIKIINSPDFGKSTDWESLFYNLSKTIAIATDGCIFVSNFKEHNIFKFSPSGEYIKKFGRKGQGPGDLYYPHHLSILDNKYLVISEDFRYLQISLFDLQGKYIKKLKTEFYVFDVIALKKDKIAYLYIDSSMEEESKAKILIKDVESEEEQLMDTIPFAEKSSIRLNFTRTQIGKRTSSYVRYLYFDNYIGEVFIARTKNGNLLVGLSSTPDIKIYSIQGQLVSSFQLKMTPAPVTSDYIQKIKNININEARAKKKDYIKKLENISFDRFFEKHLPYYRKILVDSEGNILVFKWLDCVDKCENVFQVYSPEGKYICESKIDEGIYDFEINEIKNMVFTNKGIIGCFQLKDSDEISVRLVKVKID
jgi:hypothetical protein